MSDISFPWESKVEEVEWRDLPDFPGYRINLEGQIRNLQGYDILVHTVPRVGKMATLWQDGRLHRQELTSLVYSAFPEKFKTLDEHFEEDKEKLVTALKAEADSIIADNYGVHERMARSMVERIVKEGWHPNDQC